MLPSETDWSNFYKSFKSASGLDLTLYKQDQLRRRILSMRDSKKVANLADFFKIVSADKASIQWFMDRLAINVSELFRNPEKWEEMEKLVLPRLLTQSSRLKIWSAGCSYGAEAHTLAAILHANFPGHHTIVGTDIDIEALDQANRGEFMESDLKAVPQRYKSYFKKVGDKYQASPDLKKYLTFKKGNLLADKFDHDFDLICCRNVVIYFSDAAKEELNKKFSGALKTGGVLFVGGTERIFNSKPIGLEASIPFFYQKQPEEKTQWQNAS